MEKKKITHASAGSCDFPPPPFFTLCSSFPTLRFEDFFTFLLSECSDKDKPKMNPGFFYSLLEKRQKPLLHIYGRFITVKREIADD